MPNGTPASGGVPEVVRRGDSIHLYANNTLHRFSIATGAWHAALPVSVTNATGGAERVTNASATIDGDGRIVLFYVVGRESGESFACPTTPVCTRTVRSATEVAGSEGAAFTVDAGNRASVSTSTTASDPDVYANASGNGFVLLAGVGQGVRAHSSADLRGSYSSAVADPSEGSGSSPSGAYNATSAKHWLYVTHLPAAGPSVIRRAVLDDVWTLAPDSAFATIIGPTTFPALGSAYAVADLSLWVDP